MLHIILVVVVGFEKLLYAIATELLFAFTHLFCVFPLLVVDMIRVEVVDVNVGYIR